MYGFLFMFWKFVFTNLIIAMGEYLIEWNVDIE